MGRGGEWVREGVDGVIVWNKLVGGRCSYRWRYEGNSVDVLFNVTTNSPVCVESTEYYSERFTLCLL